MTIMSPHKPPRSEFTKEDDLLLMKYLAKYCPSKQGRSGNNVYKTLREDAENKWPWSKSHPWQSWRERYQKNAERFDALILKYQEKHGIQSDGAPLPHRENVEEPNGPESNRKNSVVVTDEPDRHRKKRPRIDAKDNAKGVGTNGHPEASTMPKSGSRDLASELQSPQPVRQTETSTTELTNGVKSKSTSVQRSSPQNENPPSEIPHQPLQKRHRSPSDPFGSPPSLPTIATNKISSPTKYPAQTMLSLHAPRHAMGRSDLVGQTGRTPSLSSPHAGKSGEEKRHVQEDRGEAHLLVKDSKRKGKERIDASHHPFSQVQKPSRSASNERAIAGCLVGRRNTEDSVPPATDSTRSKENGKSIHSHTKSTHQPEHGSLGTQPEPATKSRLPALGVAPRPSFRLPEHSQQQPRATRMQQPALARVRRQTFGGPERGPVPSIDLATSSATSISRSFESSTSAFPSRRSLPAHLTPPLLRGSSSFARPGTRLSTPLLYPQPLHHHGHVSPLSIQQIPTNTPTPTYAFPTSAFSFNAPIHSNVVPGQGTPLFHTPPRDPASPTPQLTPHSADLLLVTSHGLASLLSSMSANHGLALDVVIAVYRRAGNLRETDEVLRGMREAAEEYAEDALNKGEERRDSITGRWDSDKPSGPSVPQSDRNGRSRRQEPQTTELDYVPASPSDETSEYSPPETTRAAEWKRRSMGRMPSPPLHNPVEISNRELEVDEGAIDADASIGQAEDEAEDALVESQLTDYHKEDLEEGKDEVELSQTVPVTGAAVTADEHNQGHETHVHMLMQTEEAKELEQKLGKERYRRHVADLFR